MSEFDANAPSPESISRYITTTFEGVDVATTPGATFFSLDPERHFPNFATIVTVDDFDVAPVSKLSRPGVFRLNIGVSRETYDRLVGGLIDPAHDELDRLLPHPVYAAQHWVSILNPSQSTFDDVLRPLLEEAHSRLAAQRARHGAGRASEGRG